jgi:hypothetical protein
MGGTPHWRRGHLAWLQAKARTSGAERERCAAIIERWNAAPTHDWSPAIGTALKAGYRWLDVYSCPLLLNRDRKRDEKNFRVYRAVPSLLGRPPAVRLGLDSRDQA